MGGRAPPQPRRGLGGNRPVHTMIWGVQPPAREEIRVCIHSSVVTAAEEVTQAEPPPPHTTRGSPVGLLFQGLVLTLLLSGPSPPLTSPGLEVLLGPSGPFCSSSPLTAILGPAPPAEHAASSY